MSLFPLSTHQTILLLLGIVVSALALRYLFRLLGTIIQRALILLSDGKDLTDYDTAYEITYEYSVKEQKTLLLGIDVKSHREFTLVPENRFDRVCKSLGLAEEFQVDNPNFNDHFYIYGNDPQINQIFLNTPLVQSLITQLSYLGDESLKFQSLNLRNGHLWIKLEGDDATKPETVTQIANVTVLSLRELSDQVGELGDSSAPSAASPASRPDRLLNWAIVHAFTSTLFLWVATKVYLNAYWLNPDLLLHTAIISVITTLGILIYGWKKFRRCASLPIVCGTIATLGLVAVTSTTWIGLRLSNCVFDFRPTKEHNAYVAGKLITGYGPRRRAGRKYFLVLDQETPDTYAKREKYRVGPFKFRQFKKGDEVRVFRQQGALGYPWSRIELATPH